MALYTALEDEKSISEIVRQVPAHMHFSDQSGVPCKGLSERMRCLHVVGSPPLQEQVCRIGVAETSSRR